MDKTHLLAAGWKLGWDGDLGAWVPTWVFLPCELEMLSTWRLFPAAADSLGVVFVCGCFVIVYF